MMKCDNEQDPAVPNLLLYRLCPISSTPAHIPIDTLLDRILQHCLLRSSQLSVIACLMGKSLLKGVHQ